MRKKNRVLGTAYITANPHNCKSCWACLEACPKQVFGKVNEFFGLHKHIVIQNSEACIGCNKCVKVCQYGAIVAVSA